MADPPPPDDDLDGWIASTVQQALAYAQSLVRNRAEAEDIVHDCYGRLIARANVYDLPRDGSKLLFKAITNACINATQRRTPTTELETAAHASGADQLSLADKPEVQPERQAMHRELEEAVENALEELPVTQRAVVELRSLGHSLVEVAEMLDISDANARTLLHRARARLAIRLRPFIEENVK